LECVKELYLRRRLTGRCGMSRIILLLLLTIGIAVHANAARPVTVAQLNQLLAAAHGQSDRKVAGQIAALELTERASSLRLARWETEFPGHRCHEVLTQLADAAAFLDLPTSDMPANPQPDFDAQKAMLAKAVDYANKTITRLPNFYATRQTEHYEDNPAQETIDRSNSTMIGRGARMGMSPGQSEYVPMHSFGQSSVTVSYRDGYELVNSKRANISAQGSSVPGLTTTGEFGPILALVLRDAANGKIMWAHWEEGVNGIEAVFRYAVSQGQSGYTVTIPLGARTHQVDPAYHGEIAIDPNTGSIMRITVVSNFQYPYQRAYTAIAVEYGNVAIGGTTYICPVKSVAISRMPTAAVGDEFDYAAPLQTQMNDVTFIQYHLFRSESRIVPVTGESDEPPPQPTH